MNKDIETKDVDTTQSSSERKVNEKVLSLNIFIIIIAVACVICSIATGVFVTNSFKETYNEIFVPRYNVQVTLDDISYAIEDDTMLAEDKLEAIKSSIEVLESEISYEKK